MSGTTLTRTERQSLMHMADKKVAELRFPQDFLKIQDIYLWDSKLERHLEYQPGVHGDKMHVQTRRAFKPELIDATAQDGQKAELFRVKVTLGIRAIYAGKDDDPLHSLEATFAVEYQILNTLPDDKMSEFIEFNSAHNVWPFWREHVFSTLRSASLPVLNVPFFPGEKKKVAKARKKKQAVD